LLKFVTYCVYRGLRWLLERWLLFKETNVAAFGFELLFVPFGDRVRVLDSKRLLINLVLPKQFEEILIAGVLQHFDLVGIEQLRVQVLQIVLLLGKIPVVLEGTVVADENAVVGYQVGCPILHAVNAILVKLVVSHQHFQVCLKFGMLLLRRELGQL
jgi:hypothetical protein